MKRRIFLAGAALLPLVGNASAFGVRRGLALRALPLPAGFGFGDRAEFARARSGFYLLGRDNLWSLGDGRPLFAAPLALASATASSAGTLVAIADGRLGLVNGGLFLPALELPAADARLAPGPGDTVHLFSPREGKIWSFDGHAAQLVVSAPNAIDAVALVGATLVFATPDGLFRLTPGDTAGLIFPLAGHAPLTGIAFAGATAEIFAATADAVYRLDEGEMSQIVTGLGGTVTVIKDALLIADPRRQRLARLDRAST